MLLLPVKVIADRGMAILALQDPKFPVQDAVELLSHSKHPIFGFVYESFGRDFQNVQDALESIISRGSIPKVVLYVNCGPCRAPRRRLGVFDLFLPRYTIQSFNRLKCSNIEGLWRERLEEIKGFADKWPQVRFIIIPELEDNLTLSLRKCLLGAAREVWSESPNVSFGINPIDGRRVPNTRLEVHTFSLPILRTLRRGDIVSQDGLASDPSKSLLRYLAHRGIHVLLWQAAWQNANGTPNTPPANRVYRMAGAATVKKMLQWP